MHRAQGVLALCLIGLGLLFCGPILADTITVNSLGNAVADDGDCTLHEAITAANTDLASGLAAGECAAGNGFDLIEFSVAGTIQPDEVLPAIVTAMHVDGYSAPGASVNGLPFTAGTNAVLTVEIDGVNSGNVPGLFLSGMGAAGSIIEGLVINNSANPQCCATTGILVAGVNGIAANTDTHIRGNFLGTDTTGTMQRRRGTRGMFVQDNSSRIIVGSPSGGELDPANANLLSGNTGSTGIDVGGSNQVVVRGNMIGTAASGFAFLSNGDGVSVSNSTNILIEQNLVSGNGNYGIVISSNNSDITVRGNTIGTGADGSGGLPNQRGGIIVAGFTANVFTIQDVLIEENLVAFNGCPDTSCGGIVVSETVGDQTVVGISLLGNYVYSNQGLEIDLGETIGPVTYGIIFGVTPNDPDDADFGGTNNLQNFPVITNAEAGPASLTIDYSLDSEPNSTFDLQFFRADACDASGHGGAQELLGMAEANTDAMGDASGSLVVALGGVTGVISATATHAVNGTSEFSECAAVSIFKHGYEDGDA